MAAISEFALLSPLTATSPKEKVHFSDDQQVELYSQNSDLQYEAAMKIFELFRFCGKEKILDLGCGDGKITHHMAEKLTNSEVVGVDISDNMISTAKTKHVHDRLRFETGDLTTYTTSEPYDVAHAGYSIHYVDAKQALQNIAKCLMPGGALLANIPGSFEGALAVYADQLSKTWEWSGYFSDFTNTRVYYTPDEFSRLLHECGFLPSHVEGVLQKVTHESEQSIVNYYLPVSAHAKHLPEYLRESFISELISLVLKQNGSKEKNEIYIYQYRLQVIATMPGI